MHASGIFFLIFSLVSLYIPSSALIVTGFENTKTCLVIKNINATKQVVVKKDSEKIVVTWIFKNEKWEPTTGKSFNNKINANNGKKDNFEFCFIKASRNDTGFYHWKIEKDKTQKIELQVYYGPESLNISPKPSEFQTLNRSQRFILNCSAECKPDCNILWRKESNTYITNSTVSSSLVLDNVSKNDSGNFTCLAENPYNKSHILSKRFRISVQYAAKINATVHTKNLVNEYSKTTITCTVDSNPISNISWFRENTEFNITYSTDNELVLHFQNTSCDDTGVYQCSAFNGIGQIDTKDFTLNVLCKPRFIDNYFGYAIQERIPTFIGEEIEINVSIQAYPTPQIVCNDTEIQLEIVETSNTKYDVLVTKLVSSEYDFRQHTFIIGNSQGNVTIDIEVVKKGRKIVRFYGYIIGTPLIIGILLIVLILITIIVMISTVIKRRKHQKDNQANSKPANSNDTGGYRDNILYQSIDSVPLEARDNFDVLDSDSFESHVSSSIQNLNECPEKDEESKEETTKTRAESKITINNTIDKIKGRKPMPRPRKTKPCTGNFNKVQQPRMQEDLNFGKVTLDKKQFTCKAKISERNRTPSLNSDDDSKFSLSNERQIELSLDNFSNHVSNEFAVTTALKSSKRNEVDVSLMDSSKGSEIPAKYPGLISNRLQSNIEQDIKQYKPKMHTVRPLNINIEVACESKTITQIGDEYTGSEHVADYENFSCDGYTPKSEDDPCQFHDYMNM